MRALTVITFSLVFFVPVYAKTVHVPGDYSKIQYAINAAANGDIVLVAPGTYLEYINFLGKEISVRSTEGASKTVIKSTSNNVAVKFTSGENLNTLLDGFTITDGDGGIRCEYSSPIISNNIIINNNSTLGHGISCHHSSPIIKNNMISENSFHFGGAIGCYWSSPMIINNIIYKNTVQYSGGGIYCTASSTPQIINNLICNNTANEGGGGIAIFDSTVAVFTNNTITENNAYSSFMGGGGIFILVSNVFVVNTILWNNSGSNTGNEVNVMSYSYSPSKFNICYSDVKGGQTNVKIDGNSTLIWGAGMIDADPLFVDSANGDFHHTFSSPCKDTGYNNLVTESTDFEGDPRIAYGAVDMGADEFYTHLYYMGDATPGGNVEVKFVGLPGTAPVGLCIGSGVLDPPLKSMWGDWYLQFPILGPIGLPQIPTTGVLVVPGVIPASPPAPHSLPMQALIGAELSNLCILEIQ